MPERHNGSMAEYASVGLELTLIYGHVVVTKQGVGPCFKAIKNRWATKLERSRVFGVESLESKNHSLTGCGLRD
jgi:hypothetical protein